jgi:hypothetical protein
MYVRKGEQFNTDTVQIPVSWKNIMNFKLQNFCIVKNAVFARIDKRKSRIHC